MFKVFVFFTGLFAAFNSYSQQVFLDTFSVPAYPTSVIKVSYKGFDVWMDCQQKGALLYSYVALKDSGTVPREERFYIDQNFPAHCQQKSTAAYGKGYDRGHLVPANHFDHDSRAIFMTNYMTNILPQAGSMNRGAFLETEELIECYRDLPEKLTVVGGVFWGNNKKDDFFVASHGVATPDAFWKVVIQQGQATKAIGWIIPNTQQAKRDMLDSYIVSLRTIESKTGVKFNVSNDVKDRVYKTTWPEIPGCKLN